MDRAPAEVLVNVEESIVSEDTQHELSALQLVLVGGGVGEVVFH